MWLADFLLRISGAEVVRLTHPYAHDRRMKLSEAVDRLTLVVETNGSPDPGLAEKQDALKASSELRSFLDAQTAELVRSLDEHPTAFPEAIIADTSGCSLNAATRERERANTLGNADAVADALSDGAISAGHVDALTKATKNLDEEATAALLGDDETIADAASGQTIAEFNAWITKQAKALDTTDPEDRLDKQRRATRLKTWIDDDGMYNLKGRFDPEFGKDIAKRLAAATRTKFADTLPDSAPADPLERKQYLEGLALGDMLLGTGSVGTGSVGSRPGPPVVVVDATQTDGAGGPVVDWGIPIELPQRVLLDVLAAQKPDVVVVANGVVLHAPGTMNLGRTTRLASPAQRRALAGLYANCAVPGCSVHYDRCRLHHIVFWHHGGLTNLDNLLPVCQHHHTLIHNDGWNIELGTRRELTIRLPNGQTLANGPPKRSAA